MILQYYQLTQPCFQILWLSDSDSRSLYYLQAFIDDRIQKALKYKMLICVCNWIQRKRYIHLCHSSPFHNILMSNPINCK